MKIKPNIFTVIMAVLLIIPAMFFLTACGGGDKEEKKHDATAWFTSEELTAKGLTGLTAPVELTGNIYTYDGWYNNGYSFSQQCPSKEIFEKNANIYFNYFRDNYDGKFGVAKNHAFNMQTDEEWRYICQKSTLGEYATKDAKTQYRFYYVTDTTLVDGYYKAGAVKFLELVYEFNTTRNSFVLKMFIEDADKSHNGIYTYYYVTR